MSYILKNTSGLINTLLTDTARKKISQGKFNISYFQIGDSEVSYNTLPNTYDQTTTNVLYPQFNAQNNTGVPESNKQNVKYPYYVDAGSLNTYGVPFMASVASPVYNRAAIRGFFTGDFTSSTISWSALTNSQYAINANYVVSMNSLSCKDYIDISLSTCYTDPVREPRAGDFITIYYDSNGLNNCTCVYPTPSPTPSPTATPDNTPTPTPSPTPTIGSNPCATPSPSQTPSSTPCLTPSLSPQCPLPDPAVCTISIESCYQILTYRITSVCGSRINLDRQTPDFSGFSGYARVIIYPGSMNEIYDSFTPRRHWNDNVINFESVCGLDQFEVKIWNMNIPWSENPAGLDTGTYLGYDSFGSRTYLGSKEYFGYSSKKGQTFVNGISSTATTATTDTYYYNSLGDIIYVQPEEQKAIAIIHYTNNTIDLFYGEKFALEPYDDTANDTTGQARNFRIHIPWLMWHKNPNCCNGETFYVDPPNFENLNLFEINYIQSNKNLDMNSPGIRYYNLWDTHANIDGYPSRVGKVFPDYKIIIIDDEEIIAAMSYKSNRNWTLPAPRVSLITPNTCGTDNNSTVGMLSGTNQTLYVSYLLSDPNFCINNLHCNYYPYIVGPNLNCNQVDPQNVAVRFGSEFSCLNKPCPAVCGIDEGYYASKFEIICQLVENGERPQSDEWRIIDFTEQISASTINGYITQSGLTGSTFVITLEDYNSAPIYDLSNYVSAVTIGSSGQTLNFGDEYYFYGDVETDIESTIYEMKYKINLSQSEFTYSSNPSWTPGTPSYITEIALYDSDKDLMVISKLQSPVQRQFVQQFLVKFDF
jgi:hypothetical protein